MDSPKKHTGIGWEYWLAIGAAMGGLFAMLALLGGEELNAADVEEIRRNGEFYFDPFAQALLIFGAFIALGMIGWFIGVARRRAQAGVGQFVERAKVARRASRASQLPDAGRLTMADPAGGQLSETKAEHAERKAED